MPLLVICGHPASGKSRIAEEVREYIRKKWDGDKLHLISDSSLNANFNRASCYSDSHQEREQRGLLRSEVQKRLSKEDVVICDSLNYIKGYRYELFCAAKLVKTSYCVLFLDSDLETSKRLNSLKSEQERYSDDMLSELFMRFECPQDKNRWDSPLFTIRAGDRNLSEEVSKLIYAALFEGKILKPNLSTEQKPVAPTDWIQELDAITQEIVQSILKEQKHAVPGDSLTVAGVEEKVVLRKMFSLMDLTRLRRQYMAYTKTHPIYERAKIATMFVSFINTQC